MESTQPKRISYSKQEKELLLELVEKYKSILENKKTDGKTNKQKEDTWIKLTAEYNAVNSVYTCRSHKQLMYCYKNMKKEAKHHVAVDRVSSNLFIK